LRRGSRQRDADTVDDLLNPRCAPDRPGRDIFRQRLTEDFGDKIDWRTEPAYLKVQAALILAVDPGRCHPALRAGSTVLLWMSSHQNSIVSRRRRVDDQPGRDNCPQ
jgi:hypothetical protein